MYQGRRVGQIAPLASTRSSSTISLVTSAALAAGLLAARLLVAAPAGAVEGALDLARTPFTVSGAVKAFAPSGPGAGTMTVRLRGSMLGLAGKSGELLFDLRKTPLAGRAWNNRARVSAELRVSPPFVGPGKRNWSRAHRARLFLADAAGKRLYLPNAPIVDRPKSTDGWLRLEGRPTVDVPMPLGFVDRGFDPGRVTGLGVNVEAFNREGELVSGPIELRDLRVEAEEPVAAQVAPEDPAVAAGEAERARRMEARLRERCGPGLAIGVNLAWPTAVAPNGEEMQLYGRILDGGTKWWDRYWDAGDEAVVASLRKDFGEIRETFGPGAVVRLWLFSDLRAGMTFDPAGNPLAISERARANMTALLRIAVEEKVVLLPVLLDFHLADGRARTGPDGAWQVGERPELITDPDKRKRLVKVLEDFVRSFAGHPAVLAWDVMNEPENAAAVVTPARFAALQALLRELVDAVHRAGDLATVGHHDVPDPTRFFRGRLPVDLGQVHHYPFLETRPNPTPFAVRLAPTFGALPAGWGELEASPGRIAAQITEARRAGHRLFLFWSWRGHQEGGDGYAVKPHAAEIRRALAETGARAAAP
jgi:hypothetical protein